MDSSQGIIFMCLRIPKVHKKTIPEQLSNVTVIALNHLSTGGLIGTNHVPVLFGVKLAGQFGRVNQITKHYGELAAFGFRCMRGRWWSFHRSSLVFSPDFLILLANHYLVLNILLLGSQGQRLE